MVTDDTFFYLNITSWKNPDMPVGYKKYVLTWHTEQIDITWLIKQARLIYPTPIMVVSGSIVEPGVNWPDNITFIRFIDWAEQIQVAVDQFGTNQNIQVPKFKISSLSFRYSQYKKYISTWLSKFSNQHETILTWHNQVFKNQDLHGHSAGYSILDNLNTDLLKLCWNFDDDFNVNKNSAVSNVNWRIVPYIDALVNLTNESFHYSLHQDDSETYFFPGPYITEKTWKPLLAGRPFVSVGQWNTLKELNHVGFRTDFGFDQSYDEIPGDLDRIIKIFDTLQEIIDTPIEKLYNQSLPAVTHNVNWIVSGGLLNRCSELNLSSTKKIKDFLEI